VHQSFLQLPEDECEKKVADRLRKYIREKAMDCGAGILPITCATARVFVKKAGDMFDLDMRPYKTCHRSGSFPAASGFDPE
jgi:hypothetical protein